MRVYTHLSLSLYIYIYIYILYTADVNMSGVIPHSGFLASEAISVHAIPPSNICREGARLLVRRTTYCVRNLVHCMLHMVHNPPLVMMLCAACLHGGCMTSWPMTG